MAVSPVLREALKTLSDAARRPPFQSPYFPMFQAVEWLAAVEGTSPAEVTTFLDSYEEVAQPKRWSVEVTTKMRYPPWTFWLDVTGRDEPSAVTCARSVLLHLWRSDPDDYEYRAIEVVDRRMEERS